jgi:hypothetical protein
MMENKGTDMTQFNPSELWVVSNQHSQYFSPDVIYSSKEEAQAEAERMSTWGDNCWVDTLEDRIWEVRHRAFVDSRR